MKSILFDILVMLYNTLTLPHINYCILAWGYQSGGIMLLQKKRLRAITGSKLFAHTDPLFKAISILKIEDIFTINKINYILSTVYQRNFTFLFSIINVSKKWSSLWNQKL